MKTQLLKLVLPTLAIVLAVGLAFATEESNLTQTGYYNDPILGLQSIQTDCIDDGVVSCTVNGNQVFKDPGLTILLYERE